MPFEVGLFKCQNWGRDSFVFSPKTPKNLYSIWLMKWEIQLIIFVSHFQISLPGNVLTACRLGSLPDNVNVEYEAQQVPNRERLGEVIIRISMFTNSSDICPQHTTYNVHTTFTKPTNSSILTWLYSSSPISLEEIRSTLAKQNSLQDWIMINFPWRLNIQSVEVHFLDGDSIYVNIHFHFLKVQLLEVHFHFLDSEVSPR